MDLETLSWFPDRSWGGRTYVPVTGRAQTREDDAAVAEYFG